MPKKLSDLSKSLRQQKIFNILRHHNDEDHALTVTEIHNRLVRDLVDTCLRTIKRDLEEMSTTHKLISTEGIPARFYCSDEFEPDYQLHFNESELKTMALALRSLKEMSDSFQQALCEETETIFLSKLPKALADDFERLKSFTIVSPGIRSQAGSVNTTAYKDVLRALKEERVITCENHSPYKPQVHRAARRTFSPLKLNFVGGEQYLLVHDHEDGIIKRLKICRMKNVKVTDERIDPALKTSVDNLDASIGGYGGPGMKTQKYVIHCDELMFILFQEKMIHSSQECKQMGDSFVITFEANPSIEITRYLAGWAKHIKKVEPEEVMDEIRDIWKSGLAA